MTSKRIIVLGAGLTGLSVAWHLQKSKASCEIFEKEIEVGGLCRSQKVGGFTFDYTGHLLHFKNPGIFSFIKKLLGNNLAVHKRSSWVYFSGRHIPYPFQANLHGLPPAVIKECLLSLIGVLRNKNNHVIKGNFSDWIDYNLGRGIARYFMRPYNSKFWTIPCDRLSCDWHNNIVPQPSPSQIIEGALGSRAWNLGYNSKFWYPVRGGIEVLPLAIDSQISNVHTESEVKGINIRDKRIVTASGKEHKFDYLVSTIPLPELHKLISVVPHRVKSLFDKLSWNSITNINLGLDKCIMPGKNWVYFHQKELIFFRVGFYHSFSSFLSPSGKGSLYAEVSYSKRKPLQKDALLDLVKKDLRKIDILGSNGVCAQNVNDIKYAYPIYDSNYRASRKGILDYLYRHDIFSCGRYGAWKYMSMEDCLLEGKMVAQNILNNNKCQF